MDDNRAIVIALAVVVLLMLLTIVLVLRRLVVVCGPQEVLVLSGRPTPGGLGFRVITQGRVVKIPIIERLDRFDIAPHRLTVELDGVYAKGGARLGLEVSAEVRVPTHDAAVLRNAIERFLGCPREDIARVAEETLEGHLRGVVAEMTPDEIEGDRLAFEERLSRESSDDFEKLGIQLDTVSVKRVRRPRDLGGS